MLLQDYCDSGGLSEHLINTRSATSSVTLIIASSRFLSISITPSYSIMFLFRCAWSRIRYWSLGKCSVCRKTTGIPNNSCQSDSLPSAAQQGIKHALSCKQGRIEIQGLDFLFWHPLVVLSQSELAWKFPGLLYLRSWECLLSPDYPDAYVWSELLAKTLPNYH